MSYIGNQPSQAAFVTDQFSGNGSTVAFTMSVAPANTASALVAISGVVQDPSTYAVSGTTLTFTAAPPSGTGNISVRYLGIPASGVTTTAYRTVTEFTATAAQTTFSPPSYTVGFINVYQNGVRLASTDYTATNGTTVVLAVAATLNDIVTVESYYVSSVLNAIPATAGSVNSTYLANSSVTPAKLSQPLTLGTSAASTSGTAIDFTNIPSWVKRITVMFNGVSMSGTADVLVQIGVSGTPVATGYVSSSGRISGTSASASSNTTGFNVYFNGAGLTLDGAMVITTLGSNIWVASHAIAYNGGSATGGGSVNLGGVLNIIRIKSASADTFDAGSINILYE